MWVTTTICMDKSNVGFMNSKKSWILKNNKNGVQATMAVNKNILRTLKSFRLKTGIVTGYKKAFEYPFNWSPLSTCIANGQKR